MPKPKSVNKKTTKKSTIKLPNQDWDAFNRGEKTYKPNKTRRMTGYTPSKQIEDYRTSKDGKKVWDISAQWHFAGEVAGQDFYSKKDRLSAAKDMQYIESKYPSSFKANLPPSSGPISSQIKTSKSTTKKSVKKKGK